MFTVNVSGSRRWPAAAGTSAGSVVHSRSATPGDGRLESGLLGRECVLVRRERDPHPLLGELARRVGVATVRQPALFARHPDRRAARQLQPLDGLAAAVVVVSDVVVGFLPVRPLRTVEHQGGRGRRGRQRQEGERPDHAHAATCDAQHRQDDSAGRRERWSGRRVLRVLSAVVPAAVPVVSAVPAAVAVSAVPAAVPVPVSAVPAAVAVSAVPAAVAVSAVPAAVPVPVSAVAVDVENAHRHGGDAVQVRGAVGVVIPELVGEGVRLILRDLPRVYLEALPLVPVPGVERPAD